MLKIILFSLLFNISLFGKVLHLSIENVTVYSNRAEIERNGKIMLNKGYLELKTTLLPFEILNNSVRITTDKGLIIEEIKVNTVYLDTLLDKKVKKKKKTLDSLKFELKALKDKMDILMKKETLLDSITIIAPKNISKDLSKGKNNTDAWSSALKFIGNNLSVIKRKERYLKRKIERMKETIKKLQREMNEWLSKQKKTAKEILFPAYIKNSGEHTITIKYLVKNAHWNVKYNIRAYPDNNSVQITYFGNIRQETGEDWNNVHLTLSTAAPVGGGLPEANPWIIQYAYPRSRKAVQFDKITSYRMKGETGEQEISAPSMAPPAQVKSTGIAIVYNITGKKSISSGKTPKKVLISRDRIAGNFSYYALPRLSRNVFLKAKGQNTTNLIYLSGNADVFVESEYVGNILLKRIAPQQTFDISLGIDKRIKLSHKLKKSLHEIRGILSKTERWSFRFETKVENYRKIPISLTLIEQIPVSREKDIKVKAIGFSPKQDSVDKDKGNYYWFVNLTPKGKFTVKQRFFVECPVGRKIRGLL